jgi:hypothetical protein
VLIIEHSAALPQKATHANQSGYTEEGNSRGLGDHQNASASEVFDLKPTRRVDTSSFDGILSMHKHCGSEAENTLDIAAGVQPAEHGRISRYERSGQMIGSIPLWGYFAVP